MKKTEKNLKSNIKRALAICSVIILCLIFLLIILHLTKTEQQEEIRTTEQRDEEIKNIVRPKGEKERMQIYLAEYLKHIEKQEYEQAYQILYAEFKQNFFPSLQSFCSYVQKNYSDLMKVDYTDIQRQGEYYILTVTITNLGELDTQITQKFIIYENALNDYTLSFQAI